MRVRIGRVAKQRGFSLVEILVSLVIGLFVVGAVMTSYLSSGGAGRQQNELSQMTEDAQIAMTLMSRDFQMAGAVDASGIVATAGGGTATFVRLQNFRPVFGCNNSFTTPNAAFAAATCVAGVGSHSIEVNYQATTATAVLSAGGIPTDCLGTAITVTTVSPGVTATFAGNRYYVTSGTGRPELHCASANTAGQPIIENVESLRFWYGLTQNWNASDPASRQPVRYVTASDVATWENVVSVRICLLMRTAEPVLGSEDSASYRDCDGNSQTSSDRRIRRAFFSTVALRNKAGF